MGIGLFSQATSDRTRRHNVKLHWEKLGLNIKKMFFTERMIGHWNGLSREVVESPSRGVVKEKIGCDTQCHGLVDMDVKSWVGLNDLNSLFQPS